MTQDLCACFTVQCGSLPYGQTIGAVVCQVASSLTAERDGDEPYGQTIGDVVRQVASSLMVENDGDVHYGQITGNVVCQVASLRDGDVP